MGHRYHSQCGSTDMIVLPSQKPIAAAKTRLRQIRKTGPGSEKPLTVSPFTKRPISVQQNNNGHIFARKPLLQYGCHDLQCQLWACLCRVQSICVHQISTCVKINTARRLRRGCNNTQNDICSIMTLSTINTCCHSCLSHLIELKCTVDSS